MPSLTLRFEMCGIVGRIIDTPHDRYVGDVIVVEIHTPPAQTTKKDACMDPWYILFKEAVFKETLKVQGLKTGDHVCVVGTMMRSYRPDQQEKKRYKPYLEPVMNYLWGQSWKIIAQPSIEAR